MEFAKSKKRYSNGTSFLLMDDEGNESELHVDRRVLAA